MSIKKLQWESSFFDFGVANLSGSKGVDIEKFAKANDIKLVWSLVDIKKQKEINRLEQMGFRFIDLKITFTSSKQVRKSAASLATEADIEDLRQIALEAFVKDSRFNSREIPSKKVKELYSLWAEKSVRGEFDDCAIVVREGKTIKGFATYRLTVDSAVIGLIAVKSGSRGGGIGSKLLKSCLKRMSSNGAKKLIVATEGKNTAAQNFYIKNGFTIDKIEAWYYKWENAKGE